MIKCLIVDDEKNNRENLSQLLNNYCSHAQIVGEADCVDTALVKVKELNPDLVFLDIKMPHKNGFQLLEQLTNINFEVIIVTAYNEYAINAIRFCAIDYLLKPIDIEELISAVDRVSKQIVEKKDNDRLRELIKQLNANTEQQKKIALPGLDKTEFVCIDEIVRFEADNNYCHVYFLNQSRQTLCKTLKSYEELLTIHGFIRTHQSHLINTKHLVAFHKSGGGCIEMKDSFKVPISRARKKQVLELIR